MAIKRKKNDVKTKKTERIATSGRREKNTVFDNDVGEKRGLAREELWSIIAFAVGLFLIVAFMTTAAGHLGAFLRAAFTGIFGAVAYIIPFYLIVYAVLKFIKKISRGNLHSILLTVSLFLFLMLANTARFDLSSLAFPGIVDLFRQGVSGEGGGLLGTLIGIGLVKLIGKVGLYILSITGLLVSLLLLINASLYQVLSKIAELIRERRMRKVASKRNNVEPSLFAEDNSIDFISEKRKRGLAPKEDITESSPSDGNKNAEENKRNGVIGFLRNLRIIDIMKDDSKFDKDEKKPPRGMESTSSKKVGRGLREDSPYANGIGLEPIYPHIPGLGLDNYNLDPTAGSRSSDDGITSVDQRDPSFSTSWSSQNIGLATVDDLDDRDFYNGEMTDRDRDGDGDNGFAEAEYEDGDQDADLAGKRSGEGSSTAKKPKRTVATSSQGKEADNATALLKHYKLPPPDLLKRGQVRHSLDSNKNLKALALKLEQTLESFNVEAKVVRVVVGPSVTRYEIQPGVGVKVKSIKQLENDIALNLEAKSIRIEAPIPGKAAVGIEVANDRIDLVSLREIIESDEFLDSQSKITFAVGMDIAGKCITADLKTMPHLLIAGSTGSGKSVCINCIIMSLLYKSKPDEVKLVLVDPKVVELGNYNGIPHLLVPVVTEPGKAASALNWAVIEMKNRYDKFGVEGVRDLSSYNKRVKGRGDDDLVMPQIVIIIDELADLMMIAPAKVEESICRLAQMARAAGMHLIVATQRPSVDVITGVIKANIPSRISFAVSSQVDSRTILDMSGAEHLMGSGDMLFNPLGRAKPLRIQGAFVSDSEVHNVIDYVKKQMDVDYSEDVLYSIESGVSEELDAESDSDELLPDAIETVVMAKQASASMLQRRFRIGYNRAARLIEMMEARGIVGAADGSRPRTVLLSDEEWVRLKFKEDNNA